MTLEQEILHELRALRNEVAELRESLKPKKRTSVESGGPSPEFESFWALYPRKASKRAAWFAFRSLNKSEQAIVLSVIPKWVESWRHTDIQYIPHASTWINQRRFHDELQQAIPVQAKLPRTDEEWLALAKEKGVNTIPGESWGELKRRIAEA